MNTTSNIVTNINNGILINNIFTQWNAIKTDSDYNKFVETIKTSNFGTYSTVSILDVIENIGGGNCSNYIKNSFISEIKTILMS